MVTNMTLAGGFCGAAKSAVDSARAVRKGRKQREREAIYKKNYTRR